MDKIMLQIVTSNITQNLLNLFLMPMMMNTERPSLTLRYIDRLLILFWPDDASIGSQPWVKFHSLQIAGAILISHHFWLLQHIL
jgi:hypothetical protein